MTSKAPSHISARRDFIRKMTSAGFVAAAFVASESSVSAAATPKYTEGALMGNGDIGVVAGDLTVEARRFYFGKSDFWETHWNTGHNAPEVSILSLGTLSISSAVGAKGDAGAYWAGSRRLVRSRRSTRCCYARSWHTAPISGPHS